MGIVLCRVMSNGIRVRNPLTLTQPVLTKRVIYSDPSGSGGDYGFGGCNSGVAVMLMLLVVNLGWVR